MVYICIDIKARYYLKNKTKDWGIAQTVECMPSKYGALRSNHSTDTETKQKKRSQKISCTTYEGKKENSAVVRLSAVCVADL